MNVQRRLLVAMSAAVVAVVMAAVLDARRASRDSLDDLAREQHAVATALATEDEPLRGAAALDVPGERLVLLARPDEKGFTTREGGVVANEPLWRAAQAGAPFVTLDRDDAVAFGLPRRAAVAGVRRTAGGNAVVVLVTAQRLRDRQRRGELRLFLTVLAAAGIVAGFGGLAFSRESRRLSLERALAHERAAAERDELLLRTQRMASWGALGMGIAHEIATPLSVMLARVEQLSARLADDERSKRPLASIEEQIARVQEVVRGLLGLARGTPEPLAPVAPEALAEGARDLVAHRLERKATALVVDVPSDLPAVTCDRTLWQHLLVNLLLNAAAAPGTTRVTLSAEATDGGVSFAVEDDGAGMTGEHLERAKQPFFTTKPEGTGLGLAIAQEIAKHHGTVLSFTALSPGTRVSVLLRSTAS